MSTIASVGLCKVVMIGTAVFVCFDRYVATVSVALWGCNSWDCSIGMTLVWSHYWDCCVSMIVVERRCCHKEGENHYGGRIACIILVVCRRSDIVCRIVRLCHYWECSICLVVCCKGV